MSVTLSFLGAAGTVTGSKYLVRSGNQTILVDVGMFQGDRHWREENWRDPPCKLEDVNAVLLTHAHIDHVGMFPRFFRRGLRCPVYATHASVDVARLVLLDSGRLQEEEAEYRAENHRSRHEPPLPLYTEKDAKESLGQFRSIGFSNKIDVLPGVTAEWRHMGHILGAASITLTIGGRTISFSGDIGRYAVPILKDPEPMLLGDLLLIESTYGDRLHGPTDPAQELAKVVNETCVGRRGVVLIPSFAIGRTQTLLYYLRELKETKQIPDVPIIIDSPMASDATAIYLAHPGDYDEKALAVNLKGGQPFMPSKTHFIRDRSESIKLNSIVEPMIIISASGMLTGGRILHHLKHRIANPNNTILFVGYQPAGGRGDWIKRGAEVITIMGQEIPVRAHVSEISGLSAHADQSELMRWVKSCSGKPGKCAIVHGEPQAARVLGAKLGSEMGWSTMVAEYRQSVEV